jgi:hypothetical protein
MHLRGACNRLLESDPRNSALLLLRAYANGIVASTPATLSAAERDFNLAWEVWEEEGVLNAEQIRNNKWAFLSRVEAHNVTVAERFGVSAMQDHLTWLKKFTDQYTREVADANC